MTVVALAVAATVRLLGEALQAAGGWTMSFAAAPAGRACTCQATYSTACTAAADFRGVGALSALTSAAVMRESGR